MLSSGSSGYGDAVWAWPGREDRTSEAPPIREKAGFPLNQTAANIQAEEAADATLDGDNTDRQSGITSESCVD